MTYPPATGPEADPSGKTPWGFSVREQGRAITDGLFALPGGRKPEILPGFTVSRS